MFGESFPFEIPAVGPSLLPEFDVGSESGLGRIRDTRYGEEHVCLPGIDLNKAVLLDLNEPGMEPEEDEGVFPNTRMDERGGQEELASQSGVVPAAPEDSASLVLDSAAEEQGSSSGCTEYSSNMEMEQHSSVTAAPNRHSWEKRPRVGQLADEQEETTLNPTALEKALRSFAARKNGLVVQPTVGTHFDSMAEALEFYNLYSWQIGFGIQYDRSRRNNEKTKTIQDIVCVCAGKPRKENSRSAHCGCPAIIRIARAKTGGWYVKEHVADHNHQLAQSFAEKQMWRSHRHIDNHTKQLIKHLRDNNVNLSKVFSVISSFFWVFWKCTIHKEVCPYFVC